jgi:putative integral membrane protein (TIGR02587 family)
MQGDVRAMRAPTLAESLREYGRGLGGGLLFSLPLLYTMEMWWAGFLSEPPRLLALLGFTYLMLLGYNRYAGMHHDASWLDVAIDSVEELGLGLLTATLMLYLIGQIGLDVALDEVLGKIVVEGAVVAIGFSVGTAQLQGDANEDEDSTKRVRGFGGELVIAFCGAVLFAANVAPTEEILLIAVETDPARLIGLTLLSIVIGSTILYFSDFKRSHTVVHREGTTSILLGTLATYAVALVASAIFLWFFGRFAGVSSSIAIRETVVLAFPATLGASAGRLLLQS